MIGKKNINSQLLFWVILFSIFNLLRIPSLLQDWWYGDENIYMSIGQALWNGKILYVDVWDHKPPMIYWVYGLSYGIFGNELWLLRLFNLFLANIKIVSIYQISRQLFELNKFTSKIAAVVSALFLLFAFDSIIFNGENLFSPLILAGFSLFFWQYKRYKNNKNIQFNIIIIGSILWSMSVLTKFHALLEIASLAFILFAKILLDEQNQITWSNILLTLKRNLYLKFVIIANTVAIVVPWLILLLYYAFLRKIEDFFYAIWNYNQEYVTNTNINLILGQQIDFLSGIQTRMILVFITILITLILFAKKQLEFRSFSIITWSAVVIFAILLPEKPYPHYLLQAVPILSILFALAYFWITQKKIKLINKIIPIVLSICIISMSINVFSNSQKMEVSYVNFQNYFLGFKDVLQNKQTLNEWRQSFYSDKLELRNLVKSYSEQKLNDKDEIYVIGNIPELYIITENQPGAKYVVDYHFQPSDSLHLFKKLRDNKSLKLIIVDKNSTHYNNFQTILIDSFQKLDSVENIEIWTRSNVSD